MVESPRRSVAQFGRTAEARGAASQFGTIRSTLAAAGASVAGTALAAPPSQDPKPTRPHCQPVAWSLRQVG